jgi:hypothetical protein
VEVEAVVARVLDIAVILVIIPVVAIVVVAIVVSGRITIIGICSTRHSIKFNCAMAKRSGISATSGYYIHFALKFSSLNVINVH